MKDNGKKGFSRRNFAKATAATGFAVLSSKGAAAQKKNVDTLKVGLLGCGNRGSGALRNCLTGNKNVQVTALADLLEEKVTGTRESVQKQYADQCAITDEQCFVGLDAYKKILATDIDILIEGTLPYSRPKHIAAAVEAKKHIFSEKPFAVDPTGVRICMDAAKKHKEMGLSMVGGTQRRHQKEYVETIQKIHDGAIGDVAAMRVYWCGSLPFVRERKPGESDFAYRVRNWYAYCWVCGDNIVEQHIHNLDVANWVMDGHPEEVFASGGRAWKQYEDQDLYGDLWDTYSCDYTYPGGAHVFSFSRHWKGCDGGVFEEAYGTKRVSNCRDMAERGMDPYVQEHVDLVNSITGAGPYLHEGQRVAESTLTAIMGRMSAQTGKRLKWDDALNSDLNLVPEKWSLDLEYPSPECPRPDVKK